MLISVLLLILIIYLFLRICKLLIHILRTGKVDSYIRGVRQIGNNINNILADMNNTANNARNFVFNDLNQVINPKCNIDSEIANYSGILRSYSNPEDNNALNAFSTVFHWLSVIVICFTVPILGGWLVLNENSIIIFACTPVLFGVCMFLQEFPAKSNVQKIHTKFKTIVGIIFTITIFCITYYFYAISEHSILLNGYRFTGNIIGSIFTRTINIYLPLLIGSLAISAVLHLCKIKKFFVHMILIACFCLILLIDLIHINMFSFILNSHPGGFWVLTIALCIPIAIVAFCVATILTINKPESWTTWSTTIVCCIAAYIIFFVIAGLTTGVIQAYFYGWLGEIYYGMSIVCTIALGIGTFIAAIYLTKQEGGCGTFFGTLLGGAVITAICYFILPALLLIITLIAVPTVPLIPHMLISYPYNKI